MSSVQVQVAEAIKTELQSAVDAGGVFVCTFEPRRSYDTEAELDDESTELRVDVFLAGMQPRHLGRGNGRQHRVLARVAVRKRYDGTDSQDLAERDRLMELAEQIQARLEPAADRQRPLTALPNAAWEPPKNDDPTLVILSDADREANQFSAVIRLTYLVTEGGA